MVRDDDRQVSRVPQEAHMIFEIDAALILFLVLVLVVLPWVWRKTRTPHNRDWFMRHFGPKD
jgi:hypothetical protein